MKRRSVKKMDAATLRNLIKHEEFDYQTLQGCLKDYAYPRNKIAEFLVKGIIIRVKKGLYVFGEDYRQKPVSREILANLIYGPSYISLEYALQYYNMIPERVKEITSVTTGRSRRFNTPLGVFSYRNISEKSFHIGMDRISLDDKRAFLIAVPEKALSDRLIAGRGANLRTQKQIQDYLLENMRIDPEKLRDLNPGIMNSIAESAQSRRIKILAGIISRMD